MSQAETFLQALLTAQFPRTAPRILVTVSNQENLFQVEPHGTRVVVCFGSQALVSNELPEIIDEAGHAAELLLYGESIAARIQRAEVRA